MLLSWKQREGSQATRRVLADALQKADRKDLSELLPKGNENTTKQLIFSLIIKVLKRLFENVNHAVKKYIQLLFRIMSPLLPD
ncbi:hypothetical protein HOLleu_18536 [Holothuria leucospilota]|uniref:Death domain-containing protein n=1 Tax=Holothuria leucospilota TaxID=206669 RepID=A0A9Q1C3T3_HOLLE|nr:hypothetical protein HOLleu_18536 [Holothuria leucospilota]